MTQSDIHNPPSISIAYFDNLIDFSQESKLPITHITLFFNKYQLAEFLAFCTDIPGTEGLFPIATYNTLNYGGYTFYIFELV